MNGAPEQRFDAPASVASRTAFRLIAQLGTVSCALLGGVIVARRLGGDGKGVVSTLSYMVALLVPVGALGLGEAGVTLVRRDRLSTQRAFESTITVLLVMSAASGLIFFLGASLLYHGRWSELNGAIIGGAVAAPLAVLATGGAAFVEVLGRPALTSAMRLVVAAASLVATLILMVPLRLAVAGGVGAMALGWAVGLVSLLVGAHRAGLRIRLGADSAYLSHAVRLGVPIFLATLLSVAATRADLLAVQALGSDEDAGLYSVALNVAYLLAFPAASLAAAAHPRLSGLRPDESSELVARLARACLLATIALGLLLGLVAPWGIPAVFGRGFGGAVLPALVLVAGGVAAALQLLLCRVFVARGSPRVAMASLATTAAAMLVLDLLLVRAHGIVGAACASVIGSVAGLAVALAATSGRDDLPAIRTMVPRQRDGEEIVALARRGLASRARS